MLTQHTINTPQVALNVARTDNGKPPLLMLHGAAGAWASWSPILSQLAEKFDLIVPDLPGHGTSAHNAECYGVTTMAQPIAELITQLNLSKFTLLGFSYGAHVALELTHQFGDKIDRLILHEIPLLATNEILAPRPVGPNFFVWRDLTAQHGHDTEGMKAALAKLDPNLTGPALELRATTLSQLDPDFLAQITTGEAMASFKPHARMQALGMPTLLMRADPAFGARIQALEGQVATALNAHVTDVQISDAGHAIHADQPEAYLAAIFDWLAD